MAGVRSRNYGDNAALWGTACDTVRGTNGWLDWATAPRKRDREAAAHVAGDAGYPKQGRQLASLSFSPLGEFSAEVSFLIHILELNFFFQESKRERNRERNIDVRGTQKLLPFAHGPTGPNLRPRYAPGPGIQWGPCGLWDDAQPTEPHPPGLEVHFLSGAV